ncbi:glutathione S-transferase family protein [Salinisphaera sp. USBA-960]|nr:glutathione S-transferase family protein [Salifodinibacter halophilus]NNC26250.1 glutathione S-transferase family protein [Salifodinibacter halophilus]
MGLLIDGVWYEQGYDTASSGGRFVRESPGYRRWVSAEAGAEFPVAAGRYRLYVSLACPWAHRALIMRRLKGLVDAIDVVVVDPVMGEGGWCFVDAPGTDIEPGYGFEFLHQLYQKADPGYTGRVTTPTLWDTERETIVSNESADIVRMFNAAFDAVAGHPERDYYPVDLRVAIDELNAPIYEHVNNGVYKTGFATTQAAYEDAFEQVFGTLDWLDNRLATQRYLVGGRLTEADWRLFATLVRFDAVYFSHFKCNRRRIADYTNLSGYLRELYQHPGVAETVAFDHIKTHYYRSHPSINANGIVPKGPELALTAAPGRTHLPANE